MSENEVLRAALIRAGGVLEHLAECASDAVVREQARDGLSASIQAEAARVGALERVAEAARMAVDLGVAGDDGVRALLAALDDLAALDRKKEEDRDG